MTSVTPRALLKPAAPREAGAAPGGGRKGTVGTDFDASLPAHGDQDPDGGPTTRAPSLPESRARWGVARAAGAGLARRGGARVEGPGGAGRDGAAARRDGAWRCAGAGRDARARRGRGRKRGGVQCRRREGSVVEPSDPGRGLPGWALGCGGWGRSRSVGRDEDLGGAAAAEAGEDSGGRGRLRRARPLEEASSGRKDEARLPGGSPLHPNQGPGRGCTGPGPRCGLL